MEGRFRPDIEEPSAAPLRINAWAGLYFWDELQQARICFFRNKALIHVVFTIGDE